MGLIDRHSSSGGEIGDTKSIDTDAMKLASMGYKQEMKRKFSVWSVLAVGFGLTSSWLGISAGMIVGINSGGPLLQIYGIPAVTLISICIGVSLSEMASAYPNSGGQYFWANELAPNGYALYASYLTGWFAWAGAIFTSASVTLATGAGFVGSYQLFHPEFVIQPWHVFVSYQMVNLATFTFNCYGKILPKVASFTLYFSLISFLVLIITVPSVSDTHQSPKFVFATFINNTGWEHDGIAFIVGLINVNWAFAALDCATHLAEEIVEPERMIPIAIMGTIGIGFVTSWVFAIAMFFSIPDFMLLLTTTTGSPILELLYRAVGSRGGAIALQCFVSGTGWGCIIVSHTWQSRLCWSFARDRGVPGHKWLSQVHPTLDVPLYAHIVSCMLVAIAGCLYLGSYTAFNSMVTACIVLLYVSYAIPVICLLLRGRNNIPHGPFWMGKFGFFANCVLLAWTLFTIVMYSFPYVKPVAASNMNYVSAVYAVIVLIITIDWFLRGRKSYRNSEERHEEAVGVLTAENGLTRESTVVENVMVEGKEMNASD